jgi:Tripartite tricarboxylate transporter TctB family
MGVTIRSPKSLVAGLLFAGIGAAAMAISTDYRMGTALHMGPGYFPTVLGMLLAVVGVASAAQGLSVTGPAIGAVGWRPAAAITGAVLVFAAIVDRFGLVPACVAAVLLASLATRPWRPVQTMAVAAILSAAAVGIFIYGLQLPFTMFG